MRTLFLSDIHLGCKYSKKERLLTFLKEEKFDRIFLVGDIIDFWQLDRGARWTSLDMKVLAKLLKLASKIPVIYCYGNHDESIKDIELEFENFKICKEHFYKVDDKVYIVTHGDIFDHTYNWIERLGDFGYYYVMYIDSWISSIMGFLKVKPWSLSGFLRKNAKAAAIFLSNYENFLIKYCQVKKCNGIICGHVHIPEDKMIGKFHYLNCGDWLTHCSGIIEEDGIFKLCILE